MPFPAFTIAGYEMWVVGITATVGAAVVSTVAYMFVLRPRKRSVDPLQALAEMEVKRAAVIARELEHIAAAVRKDLGTNRRRIVRFKSRVAALPATSSEASQAFYEKAERMLAPTFKLAAQLSNAYDQLHEHLSHLLTFAECRTDPLTGVANRRALDEHLALQLETLTRNDRPFTIAIFSVDQFKEINDGKGIAAGEKVLHDVASLFKQTVRETDFVARCGGDEFVVVMPKTRLFGGSAFGERLRNLVEQKLHVTASGGTAEATSRDTPQTLLGRADSALYSAKAAGRNVVYQHNGATIRQVEKQTRPGRTTEDLSDLPATTTMALPKADSANGSEDAKPRPLQAVGSRSE